MSLGEVERQLAAVLAELEARTAELAEARAEQAATADALKVISRSAFDLQTVLDTLVESIVRLSQSDVGVIAVRDGDVYRGGATFAYLPEYAEHWRNLRLEPTRATIVGRVAIERQVIHIADIAADPEYFFPKSIKLGKNGTLLGVPLLSEGESIGVISLGRERVEPFTERQIELVRTFADQAVIAMENARLLGELRESLERQTATSEVLEVINASPGDLTPVFDALLDKALALCDASDGLFWSFHGDQMRVEAARGQVSAAGEYFSVGRSYPIGATNSQARLIRGERFVHILDVSADNAYRAGDEIRRVTVEIIGVRTLLAVPLRKEWTCIGAFIIDRTEVRPFTDRQIAILENFAAQAVIAMENARLLGELQARTRELAKSLDDLRTAQDRLIQTEKLASLGQLTAGIAHEIKNPLNFVNNFSALSAELVDELDETLVPAPLDQKMRSEVGELTQMLKSNLEKVVAHGKRADSIVKNMLLHSREGSSEHRTADINAIVEDSLNLAYHGARAEKSSFAITLRHDFDPHAGAAELYPQEITRALLNLISNGFYAATRRRAEADDKSFEPVLSASTRSLGNAVEIRIRDNGTGIPPDVKDKMFLPFFTTKPTGEGTGLGLSMTHDIIVKQHGGRIDVETEPGVFTEFIITLPRNTGNTDSLKSE